MVLKHRIGALFAAVALSCAVLLTAGGASAAAVTLYVDNTNSHCSDAGPGTPDAPFCTIGRGAAAVAPKGTVLVVSGTYPERVSMARPGPVLFQAFGPVTITGQVNGFNIDHTSGITVRGFTITNTSSNGIQVQNAGDIRLLNNTISGAGLGTPMALAHGIFLSAVNASIVRGNVINGTSDSGIHLGGGTTATLIDGNTSAGNARALIGQPRGATGITVVSAGNTIVNNITFGNEDSGIFMDAGGDGTVLANNVSHNNGDHGIDNRNVTGGRVVGNSVYHNCTSGINLEGPSSGSYVIENNISVDNAYIGNPCKRSAGNIRVADAAPASTVANFNLVWPPGDKNAGLPLYVWGNAGFYYDLASVQSNTGQEGRGLEADPSWVSMSPSSPDMHLRTGSPAIDSADSGAPGAQPADRDGFARVDDPNTPNTGGGAATYYDRGAYEFLPAVAKSAYDTVATDGGIFTFGGALFFGSTGGKKLNKPIVGMAATPSGQGYWLVASDGGIFTFGDAPFKGSTGALNLNKPIVGMAATPSGQGYWLVATDGGVFGFGDAVFHGSTGGIPLNRAIVGMAATPTGQGYWLVASDGGIFTFGDAGFFGSTGGVHLNKPIVGMAATPAGRGYWLVATDGGIFAFGDAGFFGSTGALTLNKPIAGMAATATGLGYWLVATDGGIFAFGDAGFSGSTGGVHLNKPIVGMARVL